MTPKQILDSFSETLMRDERILSAQERTLVATLLHHAKVATSENPETQEAARKVIASAVGETVAQRAFAVLGGSIVERILENSAIPLSESAGARTADGYSPRPPISPGPQTPSDSLTTRGARTGTDIGPHPPYQPQPPNEPLPTDGLRTANMRTSPRPPLDPQPPRESARTDITPAPHPPQGPIPPGEFMPTIGVRNADLYTGPHPPVQPQHPGESLPTNGARTTMHTGPRPPAEPQHPGESLPTAGVRGADMYIPRPPISPGPETPGESLPGKGVRTAEMRSSPKPPSQPEHPGESLPSIRVRTADRRIGPRPPSQPESPGEALPTAGVRGAHMYTPRPPISPGPETPGESLPTIGVRRADISGSPHPPIGPQGPQESMPTGGVPIARMHSSPRPPSQPQHPGESLPTMGVRSADMHTAPRPPSPGPQTPGETLPTMGMRTADTNNPRPPYGPQPPGESMRAMMTEPSPPAPKGPQPPGVKAPQKEPHKPVHPKPKDPQAPGHARTEVVSETATAVLEMPLVLPARCVILDEFLAPQELEELTRFALEHEADFNASEVVAPHADSGVVNYEHRRSRVLMNLAEHQDVILERIESVLPQVLDELGMEPFTIARVEVQATASNDGDFFHFHSDNGSDRVASRYLTFVYFFHREPCQFEGGELRIHDARMEDGVYVSDGSYQSIVPRQNQIVFFPCELLHEITPVNCASQQFADSRFTVNGWLRR